MAQLARGTFDVQLTPQQLHATLPESMLGRLSIAKHFHDDLEGTSTGEMLSAGTAVKGSAAYVAIEQVNGSLHGKTGSFVLQHTGIMTRGSGELSVTVVPDSGTGQLAGLSGSMQINITGGKHSYEFAYELSPKP